MKSNNTEAEKQSLKLIKDSDKKSTKENKLTEILLLKNNEIENEKDLKNEEAEKENFLSLNNKSKSNKSKGLKIKNANEDTSIKIKSKSEENESELQEFNKTVFDNDSTTNVKNVKSTNKKFDSDVKIDSFLHENQNNIFVENNNETKRDQKEKINKQTKPIEFLNPLKDFTVLLNSTCVLECFVVMNTMLELNNPEINWFKDDQILKISNDTRFKKAFDIINGKATLQIQNCIPKDVGTYKVIDFCSLFFNRFNI